MGTNPNQNEWQCLASYLACDGGEEDADSCARELQQIWELTALADVDLHFDVDKAWELFQRRLRAADEG